MQSDQFKRYFENWKTVMVFPKAGWHGKIATEKGFRDIQIYLSDETMIYPDLESFFAIYKDVMMKPFLAYLPIDDKNDQFLEEFINELKRLGRIWPLEFMRLGIILARKF